MNGYIEQLYTPEQVASYLDIGMNTMYKMLKSQEIKAVRINKRKWKIPRSCLREYLSRQSQMNIGFF